MDAPAAFQWLTEVAFGPIEDDDDDQELGRQVMLRDWGSDWMAALDDETPLTELSIPGTHDSATYNVKGSHLKRAASVCQVRSLAEQLRMGVRFFDLRIAPNGALVHNIVDCRLGVIDALQDFHEFLEDHPSEVLIGRAKAEGPAALFKGEGVAVLMKRCEAMYGSMIAYCREDEDFPCLADVRGKLLVIIDGWNSGAPERLAWNCSERLSIHDNFSQRRTITKCNTIARRLSDIAKSPGTPDDSLDQLNITFLSGTGMAGKNPTLTPLRMARDVNELFAKHLAASIDRPGARTPLGVVVMDFPSESLCRRIVLRNFPAFRTAEYFLVEDSATDEPGAARVEWGSCCFCPAPALRDDLPTSGSGLYNDGAAADVFPERVPRLGDESNDSFDPFFALRVGSFSCYIVL